MRVDILMVIFAKDFSFAQYALKSAHRFAHGFGQLTVVVPLQDVLKFWTIAKPLGFNVKGFYEAEGKGMLHHEAIITEADLWCPDADAILHMDADCIFTDHCTPDDFIIEGKPVIYREKFEDFKESHPIRYGWKKAVENAIGIDPEWEGMCRHPNIYLAGTYGQTRSFIERYNRMDWKEYILSCQNDFPQGYAEHPTITAVAMKCVPQLYHWVDWSCASTNGEYVYEKPRDKLTALWSHCGIDGTCSRHPGQTAREVMEGILA